MSWVLTRGHSPSCFVFFPPLEPATPDCRTRGSERVVLKWLSEVIYTEGSDGKMLNFATASNTNLSKYKSLKAKFFFKKNFSSFLAISSGAKDCTQQLWVYRQHFANLSEACGDRLCGSAHFIHSGAKLMRSDLVWPKGSRTLQINASLFDCQPILTRKPEEIGCTISSSAKSKSRTEPLTEP